MGALQGSVICPAVGIKQESNVSAFTLMSVPAKGAYLKNRFWGFHKKNFRASINAGSFLKFPHSNGRRGIHCSSSMSFNNGGTAENFSESDDDYVNSSVIEAVEVKSGAEGFLIKMRDGRHVRCVHNNPEGGHLRDYAPQPAIVLKMEDGSDLLLPIIVCDCTELNSWIILSSTFFLGQIQSMATFICHCSIPGEIILKKTRKRGGGV